MKHIFFDMDGTLVDVSECFVNCVRHALIQIGGPIDDSVDLTRFIGPPILGTFRTLLPEADDALIRLAINHYRERFATVGILEARVYPEMPRILTHLKAGGIHQSIVTNRAEPLAQRTLEHLQLAQHFRSIFGPTLADTISTKADLIAKALDSGNITPGEVVMVGDHADDILAAKAHQIRTVSVTWGFGTLRELQEHGPDHLVTTPAELLNCLNSLA